MLKAIIGKEYSRQNIIVSLLILFICCAISYWPVSAGIYSLKNDATRYFLPVRYQISEMIQHGYFPFWTPYINLGHPLYTDMQSGVWNPFVWLISLFGSYNMRSLQAELLIYVYISGVSMFFLLKHFKLNPAISLSIATCYMLSGFISDSAQFPYWICGAAFLPVVFLFFYKMLHEVHWKPTLLFSFFFYLLIVTGYPGEFIIIFYFLLAYFIRHILLNKKDLFKLLKLALLSAAVFILFSLPAIISYVSGLKYNTRGSNVSHVLALTNSLHPVHLLSYIFPLTVMKLPSFGTDVLGRSSFIGLLPFFFLLISLITKSRSSVVRFLKWIFFISLVLSLGKYGLLRSITYYLLPYMDTFRHPSMFRFLTIFSGCLLAAFSFQDMLEKNDIERMKKRVFITIIALMSITSLVIFIYNPDMFSGLLPSSLSTGSIKRWLDHTSAGNWLVIDLAILLPFMFLIYYYFIRKLNLNVIILAAICNSIIHAILVQPVTVVSTEAVSSFQQKIDSYKQPGFPLPDLYSTINLNSIQGKVNPVNYGPVFMFNKKIGHQYYFITPGLVILNEKFLNNKKLRETLFNYPILYRADTALTYLDTLSIPGFKKIILSEDSFIVNDVNSMEADTLFNAKMLKFSPNEWEIEIQAASQGFYCLIQNYYPKWELFINDKKETIYLCNISLTGFKLQPGKNIVRLQFKDINVLVALYVHLFAWALIIFLFIRYFVLRRKII